MMGAPPAGGGIQTFGRAEADGLVALVDIPVGNRDKFCRTSDCSPTEWLSFQVLFEVVHTGQTALRTLEILMVVSNVPVICSDSSSSPSGS